MEAIIITGAAGGIGQALCRVFKNAGYYVIGIDKKNVEHADAALVADLNEFAQSEDYKKTVLEEIHKHLKDKKLKGLINNAAVQMLNPTDLLTLEAWQTTLNVNVTAPFLLIQGLLRDLEQNRGSVVNIGSIHAQLTKPRFAAYATSKAALVGLTKSLSVDLAGRVRVNAISPAAIETPMLKAGFADENAYQQLNAIHPLGRIGTADEVAQTALFLISDKAHFINGANLQLDGGISSVLKDL